ncbi:MAG: murein biosynthesis integral membrane protein MurJ [bacterium]
MIKKILNKQSKTIAGAAIILGAASLVSRFLGLIRDRILAGKFGAGIELDIYYASFRIPDLVYSLIVLGAISAGFIPVFVGYLKKDEKKSWHLANSILNLIILSLLVVCSILIILAPWLIKLIAPGFSPDDAVLAVKMTRIMLIGCFFLGISAIFGGILQSFRKFLIYSLAPIMYNLGIIFGVLVLVRYFGILGLAYGVVLGAFLHMAVQIPTAYLSGFRWKLVFDYKFEGTRRLFKLMPPRILGLAFFQIVCWAMTFMASFLAVGSITIFNLAHNIWSFPLGVFGISFVVASFPKLSETAQKKDRTGFAKAFSSTARQILFFLLPSTAMFIVLRAQIVRAILGVGNFDLQDTILTVETLAYFSLCLFAEALMLLCLRGFFAWEDTKTPFLIGVLGTGVRLSFAWFFSRSMGVPGLALGFSLGSILYLILLLIALKYKAGLLDGKSIFVSGIKMSLACLFSGAAAYFILKLVSTLVNTTTLFGIIIQAGLAGIAGIIIYLFFAWLLKIRELNLFLSALFSRLPWKKMDSFNAGYDNEE